MAIIGRHIDNKVKVSDAGITPNIKSVSDEVDQLVADHGMLTAEDLQLLVARLERAVEMDLPIVEAFDRVNRLDPIADQVKKARAEISQLDGEIAALDKMIEKELASMVSRHAEEVDDVKS